MADFRDYLDNAEYFLDEAKGANAQKLRGPLERCIIGSILFSWISLESFINNMMIDFSALPEGAFPLPEQAFLSEHELEFSDSGDNAGKFFISNRKRYRPLEHKILFLVAKFGKGTKFDKGGVLWQKFESMKDIRDQLTHPRKSDAVDLTLQNAEDALQVSKEIILIVSEKVWGKPTSL
ncbi:hypothetical protein ACFLWB_00575 [Chloroflexota bacterium]